MDGQSALSSLLSPKLVIRDAAGTLPMKRKWQEDSSIAALASTSTSFSLTDVASEMKTNPLLPWTQFSSVHLIHNSHLIAVAHHSILYYPLLPSPGASTSPKASATCSMAIPQLRFVCGGFSSLLYPYDPNIDVQEVWAASEEGLILWWDLGQSQCEVHRLNLAVIEESDCLEEERISTIIPIAQHVLLASTSFGEVYLIDRRGHSMTADRLQGQQNVLLSLIQSGAQMLGIAGRNPRKSRINRLIFVSDSRLLFVVSKRLEVWSGVMAACGESRLDEIDLSARLKEDVIRATNLDHNSGSALRIRVCDACLVHDLEETVHKYFLAVFSTIREGEGRTGHLWLHLLELEVVQEEVAGARLPSMRVACRVLKGLLVADDVRLSDKGRYTFILRPLSRGVGGAWRANLLWESATSGEESLQCLQLDLLGELSSVDGPFKAIEGKKSCGLPMVAVGEAMVFHGSDGICLLIPGTEPGQQPSLLSIAPHLSNRRERSIVEARQLKQLVGEVSSRQRSEILSLLTAAINHRVAPDSVRRRLRDAFSSWSTEEMASLAQELSMSILRGSVLGQWWGSEGTAGTDLISDHLALAHPLVLDKHRQHESLVKLLQDAGALAHAAVEETVKANHQRLSLALGLSSAMKDSDPYVPAIALQVRQVMAEALQQAVTEVAGVEWREMQSQGFTFVDVFYARVERIYDFFPCFGQAIQTKHLEALRTGLLFQWSFSMVHLLLQALQVPDEAFGRYDIRTSACCDSQVLKTLLVLARCLHAGARDFKLLRGAPRTDSLVAERTDKRLIDFCHCLLGGLERRALESEEFKAVFHEAKVESIEVLVALGFAEQAYVLSERYLYFQGLFRSTDLRTSSLLPGLEAFVARHQHETGTDCQPLATRYFEHLEQTGRVAQVLIFGSRVDPSLLDAFLLSRPQLSWMQRARQQRFDAAAQDLLRCVQQQHDAAQALTLCSLSKLCLEVCDQTRFESPSAAAIQSNESKVARQLTELTLARYRAQDIWKQITSEGMDRLVSAAEFTEMVVGTLAARHPLAISDQVRLAGISLRLLDLQFRWLELQPEGPASKEEEVTALLELARELWTATLLADTIHLLELSLQPELLDQELQRLVFAATLVDALRGVEDGLLSRDLVPNNPDHVVEILEQSELDRKTLSDDDEVVALQPPERNARLGVMLQLVAERSKELAKVASRNCQT